MQNGAQRSRHRLEPEHPLEDQEPDRPRASSRRCGHPAGHGPGTASTWTGPRRRRGGSRSSRTARRHRDVLAELVVRTSRTPSRCVPALQNRPRAGERSHVCPSRTSSWYAPVSGGVSRVTVASNDDIVVADITRVTLGRTCSGSSREQRVHREVHARPADLDAGVIALTGTWRARDWTGTLEEPHDLPWHVGHRRRRSSPGCS